MYPNGLVTNYVIRYRVRSKKYKMKWSIETLKLKPNNKGFPLEHQLKGDYYKTYEVEVIAVNSAGVGKSAKIQSCALKRRVERKILFLYCHKNLQLQTWHYIEVDTDAMVQRWKIFFSFWDRSWKTKKILYTKHEVKTTVS